MAPLLLTLALVLGGTGSATPLPLGADPLWLPLRGQARVLI